MSRFFIGLLGGILLFFQGCSSDLHEQSVGRIAAVVNGIEITQREVDFIYRSSGRLNAPDSLALPIQRKILADLVRAELLAQNASKLGLDNSPDFMVALHQARRQVLASFAEREIVTTLPKAAVLDVETIIDANPGLYDNRKLVVYEEVLIPEVDVEFLKELDAKAAAGVKLERLLDEFASIDKSFQKRLRVLTSDKIPGGIYSVLSSAIPGRPIVARVEDKFALILVLNSIVPAPLEGGAAERAIMDKVAYSQRVAAVSRSVSGLIDAASITYYGAYAQDSTGAEKLASLPVPDQDYVARKQFKSSVLGLILAVSLMFGVLQLTLSVSLLKGDLWLPRFWPQQRDALADAYDLPYQPPRLERLSVYLLSLLTLAALGAEFFMLRDDLPYWGLVGGGIAGVLMGAVASRLFAYKPFVGVFRQLRKPGIGVCMFVILLCSLFVFRYAFV